MTNILHFQVTFIQIIKNYNYLPDSENSVELAALINVFQFNFLYVFMFQVQHFTIILDSFMSSFVFIFSKMQCRVAHEAAALTITP